MCEQRFTILSPTSQSTVCGPEDVASRYSAVPPLGYAVDRTGRLGLRRRPDSLTRANPAYATTNAPASHGGRRGLTVRPVKRNLASRDIRVNRSNVPVAGGCTWAEPVKDFTDNVIYNDSDLRIQQPAHVP